VVTCVLFLFRCNIIKILRNLTWDIPVILCNWSAFLEFCACYFSSCNVTGFHRADIDCLKHSCSLLCCVHVAFILHYFRYSIIKNYHKYLIGLLSLVMRSFVLLFMFTLTPQFWLSNFFFNAAAAVTIIITNNAKIFCTGSMLPSKSESFTIFCYCYVL